jgi:hypothetical protein
MWRTLFHLIHIVKKNLLCEVVPSLSCLGLAHLELIIWNGLFKLLQGYHPNILDLKKLMDQRCPHMVQFNRLALPQCHKINIRLKSSV